MIVSRLQSASAGAAESAALAYSGIRLHQPPDGLERHAHDVVFALHQVPRVAAPRQQPAGYAPGHMADRRRPGLTRDVCGGPKRPLGDVQGGRKLGETGAKLHSITDQSEAAGLPRSIPRSTKQIQAADAAGCRTARSSASPAAVS